MANSNPVSKFQKGNKVACIQKGTKKKQTIIKEQLGLDNIEELRTEVLKVWEKLITSKSDRVRGFAAKELSKYLFPQKREHSGTTQKNIKVIFHNIKD